jgi:hypothetical protein
MKKAIVAKRLTKKAAYAARGIVFDGTYLITPDGDKVRPLLKKGNSKTGRAVLTWSISIESCPCRCKGCYAATGCYLFPSVAALLKRHYLLAMYHLEFVDAAIRAQLDTLKDGAEIRIHAAGDFFNDAYAHMWRDIVRDYPRLIFWTYTKAIKYESMFDTFINANIVKSIIPGVGLNFGHCGYIADAYNKLTAAGESVHICRCGIDPNQHCAGCHSCSKYKYVLFIEHSTAYNAAADPDIARVAAIIAKQDADAELIPAAAK